MGRRKKGQAINGWVNLDKPAGLTSTQALGKVRRILNAQKAGHAGTLDPLATGILPIALGEATKVIPYVQDAMKTYSFTIIWGEQRDTDDSEGKIIKSSDFRPSEEAIKAALPGFTGEIEQTPPQFSAIKIDGQRAYDLARGGETLELKSRTVWIESIRLLKTGKHTAELEMICGKGTYVRALARDLAEKLGTCGYISALRRLQVGAFSIENAISLEILEEIGNSAASSQDLVRALMPLESPLDDIPALPLNQNEAMKIKNGQSLSFFSKPDFARLGKAGINTEDKTTALAVFQGKPIALLETKGPNAKPVRVFNL